MNFAKTLSRDEMKNIMAGIEAGGCRLAYRNSDGSFAGWGQTCWWSPSEADQALEEGWETSEGQYVSGYCCTSCGSGGFSNAESC